MVKKLTVKEVDSAKLPEGKREAYLRDGDGLELRVTASGAYWQMRYQFQGRRRVLGMNEDESERDGEAKSGEHKLLSARRWRAWCRLQLAKGGDPAEARQMLESERRRAMNAAKEALESAEREAARLAARMTYGELFERYRLAHVETLRGKAEIIRRHKKDVLPAIASVYADEVTRQMVANIGQAISARGARRAAHLTLGDIAACFKWAIDTALLDEGQNPAAAIKKTRIGDASKLRDRVLSESELRHLLQSALPASKLSARAKAAVQIMLATLCRVGEVCRAQWSHVDLAAGLWRIPAENAKNNETHVIHLSEFALTAFRALQEVATSPVWVLPGKSDDVHICVKTTTKQIADRQRTDAEPMSRRSKETASLVLENGHWTSHDLRRTGATMMGELGVAPHVIDKCQNHVEKNRVTRTYQRQELMAERKAAFELLGRRLALLADPGANHVLLLPRA
ncbi:tyrosine-type recombinase/integrase [Jeongeupia chitinilytica]|uniref:Integrase n=1 Tax=Jeongeupia chitinilytica TaxID=1041641 RepID=A0ABQ3GVE7_9NEIS|nr:site-specific integrase [Jeongeupia chitinilytica]GHD56949.1 integrase [Jeongeupia chitinilytica]